MPWYDDKEEDEDLFFEEDFGSEFESEFEEVPSSKQGKEKENDFFKDDNKMAQSKSAKKPQSGEGDDFFKTEAYNPGERTKPEKGKGRDEVPVAPDAEDFFFDDEPKAQPTPRPTPKPRSQATGKMEQGTSDGGGFASVDQKTDKDELKVDLTALQIQQEELMFRVQELQKIVNNLEPRLAATQEQMNASLATGEGSSKVNAEIQTLKSEIIRLNDEISALKQTPVLKKATSSSRRTKVARKTQSTRRHLKSSKTPKEYNQALAAYKAGKYDESILLFQEIGLNNPPENLKDNIVFWIGSNYLKLDMHDDAIKQFQTVLSQFPGSNKAHDSRYLLGVCYQKKGDTGRALDALEVALKSNPPSEVRQKIEKQLMDIK